MNTLSYRLLILAFCLNAFTSALAQVRTTSTINSLWKFSKGDYSIADIDHLAQSWQTVNIPHTWNDKDVLADDERGYYRGPAWYFRELEGAFDLQNKQYFLHFEGANQVASVYINGQFVGEHKGGYSAFTLDISPYITANDNTLAVKVTNAHDPDIAPLSADFTFFGGIYRDLWLIETNKIHFDLSDHGSKGIYLSTPQVNGDQAQLKIRGAIQNHTSSKRNITLQINVIDPNGNSTKSHHQKVALNGEKASFEIDEIWIKNPMLWSPDAPNLYQLEANLLIDGEVIDEQAFHFGIRTFDFDANEGFRINGQPLKLIGANRHQDYMGNGNALSDEQHYRDLKLIKDMGANVVRLAHYPQDPAVLAAADKLGLLVWEETPLVNEVTLSAQHDNNAEVMLIEMIRQHYNHPSVIIWGYMNEIYWAHRFIDSSIVDAHTAHTVALAQRLEQVARTEDPSRYTAMALHNYPLYESSQIAKIPQIVSWNLYHGWYYDAFDDFGKFMDEQHQKYPNRIHFISEFGAGSDERIHSTKPEKFDFSVEGQKRFLESFLKQIHERPYISGATVWNLIDFSSERRIDTNPHLNNKGIMTSDRKPKDVYYLFQAYLLDKPFLKIAETGWTNRSSVTSDQNSARLPVQIYSNMEKVTLYHNGKSLGEKLVVNKQAIWEVDFTEGDNNFSAKATRGSLEEIDQIAIHFKGVPKRFEKGEPVNLRVNLGSNHSFRDDKGNVIWIIDQAYEKGSWGSVSGKPLYVGNKIGTKEDILTENDLDPLYQTMSEGIASFNADVPDGWYTVELLMVEPFPKSRRFVDGIESPDHPGGLRIFDVIINDKKVLPALDLLKDYGYNYPIRKKYLIKAQNGEGIKVTLDAIKGKPILSAISIQSH
ncbi:glycoside hydrolase family 2 TIM barrel-domain containing protein [Penaeicola halotolerans]|uniref:glycoside hydrolase family 2 TIM barrel-domain containing protein n=1 Tax=Penaeicola halotolerans TaxID=2793196 RepID=UPI001CF8652B|nr:glycoside hydrolase family 2 TIM barrel-domain containing protein [Penaeicola halotolerans]